MKEISVIFFLLSAIRKLFSDKKHFFKHFSLELYTIIVLRSVINSIVNWNLVPLYSSLMFLVFSKRAFREVQFSFVYPLRSVKRFVYLVSQRQSEIRRRMTFSILASNEIKIVVLPTLSFKNNSSGLWKTFNAGRVPLISRALLLGCIKIWRHDGSMNKNPGFILTPFSRRSPFSPCRFA